MVTPYGDHTLPLLDYPNLPKLRMGERATPLGRVKISALIVQGLIYEWVINPKTISYITKAKKKWNVGRM